MKWAATDLPKLRRDLIQSVADMAPALYENHIRAGRQEVRPRGGPVEAGREMARLEVKRLSLAELFYVTEDMTDLVKVAAETLPPFTLLPQDLPSPYGFVHFAAPVLVLDYDEGPAPVVAASWGIWEDSPFPNGAVWITTYTDGHVIADNFVSSGLIPPEREADFRRGHPAFAIDNEGQIPFSEAPIGNDPRRDSSFLPKVLRSTWLLMSQTVSSVQRAELSRAQRKQALRAREEPAEVRVVSLRRRKGEHGEGDGSREYHHRWIVRGHWRQQWCPSVSQHRPTWIAPHLKGPEGAPLLGGERVYSLRQ